jgi:hypothetical protein
MAQNNLIFVVCAALVVSVTNGSLSRDLVGGSSRGGSLLSSSTPGNSGELFETTRHISTSPIEAPAKAMNTTNAIHQENSAESQTKNETESHTTHTGALVLQICIWFAVGMCVLYVCMCVVLAYWPKTADINYRRFTF